MPPIPSFLRQPARRALQALDRADREARSPMRPAIELGAEHLRRTRTVADRSALLRGMPRGGVVVELGVDEGGFSAEILERCQPETLHLVDPWSTPRYGERKARQVEQRFARPIADGRVRLHRSRSVEALSRFEDASLDWIYIDSDHSYATTAAELRLGARKLKPGGLLAGHDYVTGSWDGGVRYGVVEAVHAFCVHEGWELLALTAETHRHLSFVLGRIGEDAVFSPRPTAPE